MSEYAPPLAYTDLLARLEEAERSIVALLEARVGVTGGEWQMLLDRLVQVERSIYTCEALRNRAALEEEQK